MNKIIFPLKLQTQGEGVTNLQEGLQLLLDKGTFQLSGSDLNAAKEQLQVDRNGNIYGNATRNLVSSFQVLHRLQASGEVDAPTAEALNAALEDAGAFAVT